MKYPSILGRVVKALLVAIGLALSLVPIASAQPSSSTAAVSVVIQENYDSLSTYFSDEELTALDEISSDAEIRHLVSAIENPESVLQVEEGNGGFTIQQNGCTYSPDSWGRANFKPSCDRHDICYSPSSSTNRLDCDIRFRADLKAECGRAYGSGVQAGACRGVADVYYGTVRKLGSGFYKGSGLNN